MKSGFCFLILTVLLSAVFSAPHDGGVKKHRNRKQNIPTEALDQQRPERHRPPPHHPQITDRGDDQETGQRNEHIPDHGDQTDQQERYDDDVPVKTKQDQEKGDDQLEDDPYWKGPESNVPETDKEVIEDEKPNTDEDDPQMSDQHPQRVPKNNFERKTNPDYHDVYPRGHGHREIDGIKTGRTHQYPNLGRKTNVGHLDHSRFLNHKETPRFIQIDLLLIKKKDQEKTPYYGQQETEEHPEHARKRCRSGDVKSRRRCMSKHLVENPTYPSEMEAIKFPEMDDPYFPIDIPSEPVKSKPRHPTKGRHHRRH